MLEIECPPHTCMALMEANAGMPEDEYLLGCGTELSVIEKPTQLDPYAAADLLGASAIPITFQHLH